MKRIKHYAAKHPEGTETNPEIAQAIKLKLSDNRISCAALHKIVNELGVSPVETGKTLDLLDHRISKCLLGLFGYEKKILRPVQNPEPELAHSIKTFLIAKALPCADAWKIADDFKITKRRVAEVCDALKIKIKPCQLGAF